MSVLSQFSGGGIPRPAGLINGANTLSAFNIITDATVFTVNDGVLKVVATGALTANTLSTILSLSGKGVISYLGALPVDTTSRTHRFKVTLDGTVIYDATSSATTAVTRLMNVIGQIYQPAANSSVVVTEPIFFNTSLLIEYASSVSETAKTTIAYRYYAR